MSRSEVLEWIDAGRIAPEQQDKVLRAAGITPSPADWRGFLIQLSLWLGTVALAAALIFFFAFNWDDLGRYAKFGLVEALILVLLAALWWTGIDRPAGKAVLVALSLMTGALLALTGQVYQTGADTWELFGWWAVLILPWAMVGRFAPLWLLWLFLLNLAVWLYFSIGYDGDSLLWTEFGLNTAALALWEAGRRHGLGRLRNAWAPRLIVIASGFWATGLAAWAIVGDDHGPAGPLPSALAYFAWLGAIYYWYRMVRLDAFMLAGGLFSLIVVTTMFLGDLLLDTAHAGGFLLIGVTVIAMSAGGAVWLGAVVRAART